MNKFVALKVLIRVKQIILKDFGLIPNSARILSASITSIDEIGACADELAPTLGVLSRGYVGSMLD